MSDFTVLIPVYNGADFVGEAIKSVAEQNLQNVRVTVSDNGSTDGTAEILEVWKRQIDLNVIRQAKTLPMHAHFNALLDTVETQFYMLLCHDDYLAHPDALLLARLALQSAPDLAAVYCDLLYVNSRRRTLATRSFKRKTKFDADAAGRNSIKTARNQFGIPLGIRRSSLGQLRYDPRFYYLMDIDLSWALSRHQMALHIPRPLIANRYNSGNTTWKLLSNAHCEYSDLAKKYNFTMNKFGLRKLMWINYFVSQQKRLFGVYANLSLGNNR